MTSRVAVLSALAVAYLAPSTTTAQQRTVDLASLAPGKGLQVHNRTASTLSDGGKEGLHLDAGPGDGLAYVDGVELGDGTIELDIRGKDLQGQSFVGVAILGTDSTTSDAISFRPLKFRTEDPARRFRAVQYISQPIYPWNKLRAEHPGVYEKPVNPVPDPNDWFHARVVIDGPKVSVFVNDATEPCLVVTRLSTRTTGRVGLWVGNGSAGDFANLVVRPS